jgi:predicted alpha-1,2-mannosidase
MRPSRSPRRRVHKRLVAPVVCAAAVVAAGCPAPEPDPEPDPLDPIAHTDPFIGSGGFGFGVGSAFPGAVAPQGLVKVGPDTNGPYGTVRFLHYSGYWYGDDKIQGFSHLHLHGTGACDYGVLSMMPMVAFDEGRTRPSGYQSEFSKETEVASPGYYAVHLDRDDVHVALTATTRAAHHRYTFPEEATVGHVVLDLAKHLESGRVDDAEATVDLEGGHVRGRLRSVGEMSRNFGGYDVFFDIQASQGIAGARVWADGASPEPATEVAGENVGLVLAFDLTDGPVVELQVGVSFVSGDGARDNRVTEMPQLDFEGTRARTEAAWREILGRVRVAGATERELRILYASIYRSYLMPTIMSDVDGRWRGPDDAVRTAAGYRHVTDMSLWDTYRTVHPFYALLTPDRALDAVRSLHAFAEASGFYPKWPLATGDARTMVGASAEVVLADAWMRDVRDFDVEGAYAIARAAAMDVEEPPGGRGGRDAVVPYMDLGWVPAERNGSVSVTLEYAYNDFALAHLARVAGRDDDAEHLLDRSKGYRALYDPDSGFLRGRLEDGSWSEDTFDPLRFGRDYVEANAWHSLFAAHDAKGLETLLGGPAAFLDRLLFFFEEAEAIWEAYDPDDLLGPNLEQPYYWHANEPAIHVPFMFAQVGRPDLSARWARWAADTFYDDTPDGLPGNDDGGTMSAWWIYSAMGFYPLAGTDLYVVSAPRFPRMEVDVPGGTLVIEAEGAGEGHRYVASLDLDGRAVDTPWLRHADLAAGGVLRFVLAAEPTDWGRARAD